MICFMRPFSIFHLQHVAHESGTIANKSPDFASPTSPPAWRRVKVKLWVLRNLDAAGRGRTTGASAPANIEALISPRNEPRAETGHAHATIFLRIAFSDCSRLQ